MQDQTTTSTTSNSLDDIIMAFPMAAPISGIENAIKRIRTIAGAINATSMAGEATTLEVACENHDSMLTACVGEHLHKGVQMHCEHLDLLADGIENEVAKLTAYLKGLKEAKQN